MKLLKRFGYYLVGLALGSIVVVVIWKGKDANFDYGPSARTLKSIRKKTVVYSENALKSINSYKIDTSAMKYILKTGKVAFSKSNPRKKPCAEYYVTGKYNESTIDFWIIRCDSTATIDKVWLKD